MVRIRFRVCLFLLQPCKHGLLKCFSFFFLFNLFQAAVAGSVWDVTQNSVL